MFTITDNEFGKLAEYIEANYGIHMKKEKRALLTGRLSGVLQQYGFSSFGDYYNYVISDKSGNAATVLVNKITTNHTYFMREADHFRFFRDIALPYFKSAVRDKDLRIWSAGCSTGEEPYTLAMLVDEFFGKEKVLWDSKILATDISSRALDEARNGLYGNEELSDIPLHWKTAYFRKIDSNSSMVREKMKAEVIYRKFNLMEQLFPFKRKFHVIFCRNVMIYFDSRKKRELVNRFYDCMEHGGFLFIGHSESLSREETKFKYIMPAIYRKE